MQHHPNHIQFQTVGHNAYAQGYQTITLPVQSIGFDSLRKLGQTLFVIDAENLNFSLSKIGYKPDYAAINQRLEAASESLEAHVFMTSADQSLEAKRRYFASVGIAPHLRATTSTLTVGQPNKHINSDNELLLRLGFLCGQRRFDTVVLGTGDGALGCAAANFLAELTKPPKVYTLSVQGATSNQLLAGANWLVNGNLALGADLVRCSNNWATFQTRH